MSPIRVSAVVTAIAMSAFAGTAHPQRASAESAAIDSVYAKMSDAYRKRDAAAVARLYADGAYYLQPGSPILAGRPNIESQFRRILGATPTSANDGPRIGFRSVDRGVSGDLAYDIGEYAMDGGEPSGKFITILKRGADRQWRFWADGFSGLEPARGDGEAPEAVPMDTVPGIQLTAEQMREYVGALHTLHPVMSAEPRISIAIERGRLRIIGLAPNSLLLVPAKADEFRVIDPDFPVGHVLRVHRTAGRIGTVIMSSPSPRVPVFVFR